MNYEELERFISPQRLESYLQKTKGDKQKACNLYNENLKNSGEIYRDLHWLEIGLRNSINEMLSNEYGEQWFNCSFFAEKEKRQIAKAKDSLAKNRKILTNSNMLAELNFGLWVNLFNDPYEQLWRHCLRKVFTKHEGNLSRKQIAGKLHLILKIRNRVAHYEPLIKDNKDRIIKEIRDVVRWIDPDAANALWQENIAMEYQKEFEVFSKNVEAATRHFYYHKRLNTSVLDGEEFYEDIYHKLYSCRHNMFWLNTRTVFLQYSIIVLGRIFDQNSKSHSIHSLLKTDYPNKPTKNDMAKKIVQRLDSHWNSSLLKEIRNKVLAHQDREHKQDPVELKAIEILIKNLWAFNYSKSPL
ncbi:MAG: Swt1 family HEPN domain-containing protein [Pseudomonadota bacterium]